MMNKSANIRIKDRPNKVRAKLIIDVEGEFYDDESTAETLRYCVEQDLEDAGFNVIDSEVFELANKGSEQQSYEDCISREEAIKKLKALSWTNYDLDDAAEVLKRLPSVQPQRHKGTWKAFDTTFGRNIYYCTACGRSIEILYEYDFCPICGADMKGDSK